METFVQWATILSPIIAVLIAWWTSRSSAKALKESTRKEIQSIKELAALQLDTTILEMEYEFFKTESTMKDYRDEIEELQRELQRLNLNPRTTELDRMDFMRKIEKITKDSNRQKGWWMKLFHAQAQLSFAKSRILNYQEDDK